MGSVCIRVSEMPDTLFSKTGEKTRTQKKQKRSETVTAWNNEDLSFDQTNETFNC